MLPVDAAQFIVYLIWIECTFILLPSLDPAVIPYGIAAD